MAVSGVFVTVIQIMNNMQITLTTTDGSYVTVPRNEYDRLVSFYRADLGVCAIIIIHKNGLSANDYIIDPLTNHL